MHKCIKFILFWNDILHVSVDLSIYHQDFKTIYTATGIWLRHCATSRKVAGSISDGVIKIFH